MTTITTDRPHPDPRRQEAVDNAFDAISWHAALSGVIAGLAVEASLLILGMALGLAISRAVLSGGGSDATGVSTPPAGPGTRSELHPPRPATILPSMTVTPASATKAKDAPSVRSPFVAVRE